MINYHPQFGHSRSSERSTHRDSVFGCEHDTLDGLHAQFLAKLAKATAIAGRPLNAADLKFGPPKEQPKTEAERQSQADELKVQVRRHHLDLNPPAAPKSPEQLKVDRLAAQVDEQRRSKLSPVERQLEDAKAELVARERADAQAAAAAEIRATPGYVKTREALDEALFRAKFDPTISPAIRADLEHQAVLLERNLDVATTRANLAAIRDAIVKNLEPQKLALKHSQDALAARESLLAVGPWDNMKTEVVGSVEYLAITMGDKTVKISKQRFDARASDDALAGELFPEVTNV